MLLFPKSNIIKFLNIFWLLNNILHSLKPMPFEFIVNDSKLGRFCKYYVIISVFLDNKLLYISVKDYKDLD